jgi:hypothetical protein
MGMGGHFLRLPRPAAILVAFERGHRPSRARCFNFDPDSGVKFDCLDYTHGTAKYWTSKFCDELWSYHEGETLKA